MAQVADRLNHTDGVNHLACFGQFRCERFFCGLCLRLQTKLAFHRAVGVIAHPLAFPQRRLCMVRRVAHKVRSDLRRDGRARFHIEAVVSCRAAIVQLALVDVGPVAVGVVGGAARRMATIKVVRHFLRQHAGCTRPHPSQATLHWLRIRRLHLIERGVDIVVGIAQ